MDKQTIDSAVRIAETARSWRMQQNQGRVAQTLKYTALCGDVEITFERQQDHQQKLSWGIEVRLASQQQLVLNHVHVHDEEERDIVLAMTAAYTRAESLYRASQGEE